MTAANSNTAKGFVIAASLIVITAGLKAAGEVAVPFLLAAFIATIAATPMYWMERRGVPGWLAISLVIAAIFVVLLGLGALAVQSANAFTAKLPFYQERVTQIFTSMVAWLAPFGIQVSTDLLVDNFNPATAFTLAGNALASFGSALSNSFLILLTVIFILAEATSFPRKLREVLRRPDESMPYFERFAENMNRYIAIKTSVSLTTGLAVTLLLWVLGVDFPILWGMLAFLLNFVPNIGSIIAAVPAVLLALVELGPLHATLAALGYVALNIVMGNFVEPRFMGRGLGLSTLVVFLSLVLWGWVFGPVGMLLSVPLTMTAKIALEANPATLWLARLLGPADEVLATAPPGPQVESGSSLGPTDEVQAAAPGESAP